MSKTRHAIIGVAALAALTIFPSMASAAPKHAYVSDANTTLLYQLTIGANQTLSFNSSIGAGSGPNYQAVTRNGKYLYVTDDGPGGDGFGTTVSQFKIGSNGALTPLSPATVAAGQGPVQIAVSPDGKNAYVANFKGSTVNEYSIASNGTLHPIGTLSSGYIFPEGVAVSPDGSSVYIVDPEAGQLFEYNRASNGTLSAKSPASVTFTAGYVPDPSFTPDGKYLYVSGNDGEIDEYSVGSGGQLSPLTVPSISSGADTTGMVVSPSGHNVYASSCDLGDVYQYRVGSGGQLAPLSPASVTTDGCGVPWMRPGGTSLYAPDGGKSVYQFRVTSSGALSPRSPAKATESSADSLYAIMIPPDLGPIAKFSDKVAGRTVEFNARKSSAPDGKVVRYHWSFGDGHSLTTTKAKVSHTYKKRGTHTVTLTVTDDAGCSTSLVFTGQSGYCSPGKSASHKVKAAASTLKLKVTPSTAQAGTTVCYAFTVTSKGKATSSAKVTLGGHSATTNSAGKATSCQSLSKGKHTARATKHGFVSATAVVTVTAAPAFTG